MHNYSDFATGILKGFVGTQPSRLPLMGISRARGLAAPGSHLGDPDGAR